jgi:hypothetical protein
MTRRVARCARHQRGAVWWGVRRPDLALHAPGQVAAKTRAAATHVSQQRLLGGPASAVWGTGVELFRRLGPGSDRRAAGHGGAPDGLSRR